MKKKSSLLLYPLFIILFCLFPAHAFTGAWAGFVLWATNVLPALFPFFVISSLLQSTGIFQIIGRFLDPFMRVLFRVPGACGGVLALSFMSGSPSGARMTGKLFDEGIISKDEAQRLAAFTTTCGPSFLLGCVGVAILGDASAGLCVLISHYAASLLNGFFFRFYSSEPRSGYVPTRAAHIAHHSQNPITIGEAVSDSASAMMIVGGFVALFSAAASVARAIVSPLMTMQIPWVNAVFCSVMELVSGCSAMASLSVPNQLKTALVCAAASFGGLSVWAQCMAFLKKTGINSGVFLLSKISHALIAFVICYFLNPMLSIPTWVTVSTNTEASNASVSLSALSGAIFGISILSAVLCCLWILWCKKHGFPQVYVPNYEFPYAGSPLHPIYPVYIHKCPPSSDPPK